MFLLYKISLVFQAGIRTLHQVASISCAPEFYIILVHLLCAQNLASSINFSLGPLPNPPEALGKNTCSTLSLGSIVESFASSIF